MRTLVLGTAKEAVKDTVNPYGSAGSSDKEVYWVGPYTFGPLFFALHGPLQLIFLVMVGLSVAFLVIEYRRSAEFDWVRSVSGVIFILVCLYLVYLGKAIYVLKAFRKEIGNFRRLNRELRCEVGKLETENVEYEKQNQEHAKLNEDFSEQIKSLGHVEAKLSELSADCNGSVQEVKNLLGRLERFIKLDTVNSVFQFFDRSDRDRNGKVDGEEVALFVQSISVLWRHLPHFKPERMKEEILEQGGLSLEQVHKLVDLMLQDEAGNGELTMTGKLDIVFGKEKSREDNAEEDLALASPGSSPAHPGAVVVDP